MCDTFFGTLLLCMKPISQSNTCSISRFWQKSSQQI